MQASERFVFLTDRQFVVALNSWGFFCKNVFGYPAAFSPIYMLLASGYDA